MKYKAEHQAARTGACVKIPGIRVPSQEEGLKVLRVALVRYRLFADPQARKEVAAAIWISMRECRRLIHHRRIDSVAGGVLKVIQDFTAGTFALLEKAAAQPAGAL